MIKGISTGTTTHKPNKSILFIKFTLLFPIIACYNEENKEGDDFMWVVERIDEKGYYHLENLKTGETILKRNLNAQENDVLDDCFHVLPEETRKRKQEVDDFFHSLL